MNCAAIAKEKIQAMTTKDIIDAFVETGSNNDKHIYIVRGWLMDELEDRDPEAFSKWLNMDWPYDEDLYKFYS